MKVRIGMEVRGACGRGVVKAMTEKWCIWVGADGSEYAETWNNIWIVCDGPEETPASAVAEGPDRPVEQRPEGS